MVSLGEKGSSNIYKAFNDGAATDSKMKIGTVVQIISIVWLWSKKRSVSLYFIIVLILNPTRIVIIVMITIVKSWKVINSSIILEALSCSLSIAQVGIFKEQGYK